MQVDPFNLSPDLLYPIIDATTVKRTRRFIKKYYANDMIRGTVFCDYGTVEKNVALHPDLYRVAPGFGFRINVPAMGPAPLAFDFAF